MVTLGANAKLCGQQNEEFGGRWASRILNEPESNVAGSSWADNRLFHPATWGNNASRVG